MRSSPINSVNPATGRRLATYRAHSARETDRLVDRAQAAFAAWRQVSPAQRARTLRAIARGLRRDGESIAALITAEMGKPLAQARAEIAKSALACDFFAEHGPRWLAPEHPPGAPKNSAVHFAPLGPVLAIMPWNFPVWQATRAFAPALLAGNPFLLKPAPTTVGCSLALARVVAQAGGPAGLFQTLLIEPPAIAKLIADPRLATVTLTGSTRAGRAVAAAAGAAMKPGVFELGGSDAYLILGDADLDRAVELCAQSRLLNNGQSCIAAKRFIAVRDIASEFTRRLVARLASARVGDPTRADTDVGPLAREDLRAQLHRQVRQSVRRGARVRLGGAPQPGPGFFYPPTVLDRVRPGMPAADEELFGPVAAVMTVRNEAEAVALANATDYGLGAAIFTRDRARARKLAAQLEAGFVAINDFVRSDPALPFGGVKQSGHGRELALWGVRSFVNIKTVCG